MFEYAAIIGVCRFRYISTDICAYIPAAYYYSTQVVSKPVKLFIDTFGLSYSDIPGCKSSRRKFQERFNESSSAAYDPSIFYQPSGTTFTGYLQSFRYFHPHAYDAVRDIYTLPIVHQRVVAAKLDQLRSTQSNATIVGIHVRLGDKVWGGENDYDKWSLSMEYYKRAVDFILQKHTKAVLLVHYGGAFDAAGRAKDREQVHRDFEKLHEAVIFEDSDDPIYSMTSLTMCDALIISASSFAWWAAYLARPKTIIIAPRDIYQKQKKVFNYRDYYLPNWILLAQNISESVNI